MKTFSMRSLLTLIALLLAGGCTLYKSNDRESFNSNALAGAPRRTGEVVPAGDCARGTLLEAEAHGAWNERGEIVSFGGEGLDTRLTIAKQIIPLERGLAVLCKFTPLETDLRSPESLDEFVRAAREQAESRAASEEAH
jgi:hypothetical protein